MKKRENHQKHDFAWYYTIFLAEFAVPVWSPFAKGVI